MTKQEEQSEIFKKVYFPEKPKKDGEYTCGNDNFSFKLNFMKGVWVCQNPIAIAWFYEPIEPQPPLEGEGKIIFFVENKTTKEWIMPDGRSLTNEPLKAKMFQEKEYASLWLFHATTNSIPDDFLKSLPECEQPTFLDSYDYEVTEHIFIQSPKPVEGDVRDAMIETFRKVLSDKFHKQYMESPNDFEVIIVDALLSKYNFTRKG